MIDRIKSDNIGDHRHFLVEKKIYLKNSGISINESEASKIVKIVNETKVTSMSKSLSCRNSILKDMDPKYQHSFGTAGKIDFSMSEVLQHEKL